MHELPITENILNIVLKYALRQKVERVVTICLKIGELAELEDKWIQHYFDYFSKGTLAAGAKLVIEKTPIVLKCDLCSNSFKIKKEDLGVVVCQKCGKEHLTLISGKEYYVKNMEAV